MADAPVDWADGGEAGLTLVELLVAMALLSFVALLATQGVRAVQAMMPLANRIDGTNEVAAVRDHLGRTVEEAMATLSLGAPATFEGRQAELRLSTLADPVLEIGGIAEIRIGVEGGEEGLDLVERRDATRSAAADALMRTVLLSGIASLSLSYSPVGGGWTSEWPRGGGLPALVRVEIAFPEGDPRRFRPLVVHPAETVRVGGGTVPLGGPEISGASPPG